MRLNTDVVLPEGLSIRLSAQAAKFLNAKTEEERELANRKLSLWLNKVLEAIADDGLTFHIGADGIGPFDDLWDEIIEAEK